MSKDYSEDKLVEKSALEVFVKTLGYRNQNCYEEKFPDTLGREIKSEVVLVKILEKAIEKLNPNIGEEAKEQVFEEILKDRSRLSLANANHEIYQLLKDGVKVKIKGKKGGYDYQTVRLIDFDNPETNDFFVANQFWVTGEIYTKRPDAVCFVNGIPLIVIEFKARGVDVKQAFDDNITDYKSTIPQLFWYNAFILVSNGRDSKIGTLTSGWEHFSDWKKVNKENEAGIISLDTLLKGVCEKSRLLDLFENFMLFTTGDGTTIKIVAKNHQFLGVNNAVESFKNRKKNQRRLGVYWHTQGAGKSFSMIFFTQKIQRKFEGDFTFLIVTDRKDLDTQIYQNFQNAGVVTEKQVQAKSGENLKKLLKENHRLVFTLIQKFNTEKGVAYPELSERNDIIVVTDEAHRSQYDVMALNMRNALPKACFIGFTGTPLMQGEEKTKQVFGNYISIYNFRASVEDKATVPLYYENRVPELKIVNPDLNEDLYEVIEEADLDEGQEVKLSRELSRDYHLITRDDRLNKIAEDIVEHFTHRGYEGKAMVVSIDKFTAVKMFDKVQHFWVKHLAGLKNKAMAAKLKKVDMAVVVSPEQNEVKKYKEAGLDIVQHRKRMVKEDLTTLFKDPNSDFQIVFVCNMWMTGFDVPSLSTIYLDKPMKNHTLMQAIARANRVFKEKKAGFIVDYINVFRNLKKALAIYAAPLSGSAVDLPIQSKDILVETLRKYIVELNRFLKTHGVNAEKIKQAKSLEKNDLLDKALSALVVNDKVKKEYLQKAGTTLKTYSSILPHKDATEFSPLIALYQNLIMEIRSLDPTVDISKVIYEIQNVLDKSIASVVIKASEQQVHEKVDLSKIDFDALQKQFQKNKNNADLERLKNVISFKLKEMIHLNPCRINYQEKFQQLLDEYNTGSMSQEDLFKELVMFSKGLEEEERRAVIEALTEEELALFDKLKKPKLTEKEIQEIKKVAKDLLKKLEPAKLVLDWRKRQQTRAAVRLEIEKELDEGLPESYDRRDFSNKCEEVFQHFYENYFGDGESIYKQAVSY